jgi:hypothetical protein
MLSLRRAGMLAYLILVIAGRPVSAQTNTGEIGGVVRDAVGGVLPGVAVTARHPDTGLRNANLRGDERTPDRWFDTAAFALPAQYTFRSARRNSVVGPGFANMTSRWRRPGGLQTARISSSAGRSSTCSTARTCRIEFSGAPPLAGFSAPGTQGRCRSACR